MLALIHGLLYTPSETIANPIVMVEDGTIVKLESRDHVEPPTKGDPVAFDDCIIVPGFIDLHVHGSAGFDVMQSEQTGRSHFQKFLAQRGVTAYCPTTVTVPLDTTLAALERLADSIEKQADRTGAQ